MSRLTYEIRETNLKGSYAVDMGATVSLPSGIHIGNAIDKLAAYENTGLTPEQIMEMDRLYREKCEEVEKLRSKVVKKALEK